MAATILIAEDEPSARNSLAALLEDEGFRVLSAANGDDALSQTLHEEPDAVLLDIRMPGLDGLSVMKRALAGGSPSAFLVMTAFGDSATAIEAMKLGAFDHLAKPLDFDHVLTQLKRAIQRHKLAKSSEPVAAGETRTPGMVGYSPAMQRVYKLIGQVAESDATVLVRGESGTGKELVVNAIHENSLRAGGPLVKVNCAAIPESLLESELFGHEKGAFTNAMYRRIGRFEEASSGTLFLDEIAELSPLLQAKLLRAVQERTIERLGSNAAVTVDLRLIAATSRNLEQAVARGDLREDLYYRLNVVTIALPPLRERRQDIPALVMHFLARADRPCSITPTALTLLCEHNWPGNVRELENTIARALVLARGNVIDRHEILLLDEHRASSGTTHWTTLVPLNNGWKQNVETLERSLVERALALAQGNKTRAAGILGVHRRLLYQKIRQHEL
ncbi:MAG: sigma-54-dependent Fis family transcriptional regulator [Acidobacteriaceae bacterium]|nr:sigma-54-dependent Fis family transcriptional regulator [Acidobacteriaceae bacterium]MBV8572540.1 sigma-54-dependent Fis family transcriptional regulator [Acidobacteriaceae bacterium]